MIASVNVRNGATRLRDKSNAAVYYHRLNDCCCVIVFFCVRGTSAVLVQMGCPCSVMFVVAIVIHCGYDDDDVVAVPSSSHQNHQSNWLDSNDGLRMREFWGPPSKPHDTQQTRSMNTIRNTLCFCSLSAKGLNNGGPSRTATGRIAKIRPICVAVMPSWSCLNRQKRMYRTAAERVNEAGDFDWN